MKVRDGWHYPDLDPRLRSTKTPLRQLAKDAQVIDLALKCGAGRKLVIQAGARIGIWPALLSRDYERVICFEPETRNVECARLNLTAYPNVELHHAALGREAGKQFVEWSDDTSGSHQIVDAAGEFTEPCDVVTIDSLNVRPDAIFLDIEGFELYALEGAIETIERCHPMLVLEENKARVRYGIEKGALQNWLTDFGYRLVARHYRDFIFV